MTQNVHVKSIKLLWYPKSRPITLLTHLYELSEKADVDCEHKFRSGRNDKLWNNISVMK